MAEDASLSGKISARKLSVGWDAAAEAFGRCADRFDQSSPRRALSLRKTSAECFEQAGSWSKAAVVYKGLKIYSDAGRCFDRAGDFKRAAAIYERGLLFNEAVSVHLKAENGIEHALRVCRDQSALVSPALRDDTTQVGSAWPASRLMRADSISLDCARGLPPRRVDARVSVFSPAAATALTPWSAYTAKPLGSSKLSRSSSSSWRSPALTPTRRRVPCVCSRLNRILRAKQTVLEQHGRFSAAAKAAIHDGKLQEGVRLFLLSNERASTAAALRHLLDALWAECPLGSMPQDPAASEAGKLLRQCQEIMSREDYDASARDSDVDAQVRHPASCVKTFSLR